MTLEATTFDVAKAKSDIATIQRLVAENYGFKLEDLLAKGRAEPLVTHRQLAMYLCRELTLASSPDIARAFGKKDHMTVLHACKAVPAKALTDSILRFNIERLRRIAKSEIK